MADQSMVYFPAIDLAEIERMLVGWRMQYPAMGVFALVPEAEISAVPKLQALSQRQRVKLCGAIFPQLIYGTEFRRSGVCILRFDTMPYLALYQGLALDAGSAAGIAESMAKDLEPQLDDDIPATLFLIPDAMLPSISTLLDELYLRIANRVHYSGVNAGSETFRPLACLFDSYAMVSNAVLILLLKPHHGAILEHGYQIQDQSLPATSTEGNRIIQIDWRPAFEVYQELVLAQFGVEVNRENFYQYAVHFPFGILRANGSVVVRIPVRLDEDNALFCIGEVPAHSMLALLEAPRVDSQHTLETLRHGLCGLGVNPDGSDLLLFYCAGRRQHLGHDAASEELRAFNRLTGASALAGALALGEIGGASLRGYPLFHNATLVTTDWGCKL